MRQNKYVSFYVFKRPYLDEFLDRVCEWYDVVVFTAGEKVSVIGNDEDIARVMKEK